MRLATKCKILDNGSLRRTIIVLTVKRIQNGNHLSFVLARLSKEGEDILGKEHLTSSEWNGGKLEQNSGNPYRSRQAFSPSPKSHSPVRCAIDPSPGHIRVD